MSYEDRLQHLKLLILNYRRIRGDMTELYKIITGKYDSCGLRLYLRSETVQSVTRGNNFKLVPQQCRYDLQKYYFTSCKYPSSGQSSTPACGASPRYSSCNSTAFRNRSLDVALQVFRTSVSSARTHD